MTKRLFVVAMAGCMLLPISTMAALIEEPAAVVATQDVGLKQMRDAVLQAAKARQWGVLRDEPGRIDLAYPMGPRSQKYQLKVTVRYDRRTCTVKYLDSYGLDAHMYKEEFRGHRKISSWMRNLRYDIERFVIFEH